MILNQLFITYHTYRLACLSDLTGLASILHDRDTQMAEDQKLSDKEVRSGSHPLLQKPRERCERGSREIVKARTGK